MSRALQVGPLALEQHSSTGLQQALPQHAVPLAQLAEQSKALHRPAAQ